MKLPNLLTKRLYVDRINEMLLPVPVKRDKGKDAAKIGKAFRAHFLRKSEGY
ncbi:hypothetical protein MTBBW1_340001 [Desulfamplus magnetovallimortis]|uniref:Uncharacterized protein n=1 Tax=Desulfamplus magnetovallimortis TaxID=1246637 RepID=A0A1W1HG46_9BACT|nr:hypothetical protein MTBBW1_340001 [Desulfamplus magnetovallimortis]